MSRASRSREAQAGPADAGFLVGMDAMRSPYTTSMGRLSETDRVHSVLRADIVHARIRPGVAISEQEAASRFGVSRTPVREAILRLSREGLVHVKPQRGTYASLISLKRLEESLFVRQAVEGRLLEAITGRSERRDLVTVLDSIAREQSFAARSGDLDVVLDADTRFHYALVAASGLTGLWSVVAQARDMDQRIRSIAVPELGSADAAVREHRSIVAAVDRGDAARAQMLMESHLSRNLKLAKAIAARYPEYFEP